MSKTIFITGASRGFGKIWAEAFLKRGDKVAATARDLKYLDQLVQQYGDRVLPIKLDVNDRAADFAAVKQAKEYFGNIDVLINNAGYGLIGAIEETTEKEARDQIEAHERIHVRLALLREVTLVIGDAVVWRDEVVDRAVYQDDLAALGAERREIDVSHVHDRTDLLHP